MLSVIRLLLARCVLLLDFWRSLELHLWYGFTLGDEFTHVLEAHRASTLGCFHEFMLQIAHLVHYILLVELVVCHLCPRLIHHGKNSWLIVV